MPISARIVEDSVAVNSQKRITTVLIRMPWVLSPELLRHRAFSFSSASGRAIPVKKLIQSAVDDPYIPLHWGKNQPGMQALEENNNLIVHPGNSHRLSRREAWLYARDTAVAIARAFDQANYHKQLVNRLLTPFLHINILITATEWANFFYLRRHPDAQPEIRKLADNIFWEMVSSEPISLASGEWHLPFLHKVEKASFRLEDARLISAARCARLSYWSHEGKVTSNEEDLDLAGKLLSSFHMSPFEHQATPDEYTPGSQTEFYRRRLHGNFVGWVQHRKTILGENVTEYEGL